MRNYKTQMLVFFLAEEADDELKRSVQEMVERMATKRDWTIGPPQFVSSTAYSGSRPEDVVDVTIGGVLHVYSAVGQELPRELDLMCLGDVEQVIDDVKDFSKRFRVSFEFELDRQYVGAVDAGILDRSLQVGLMEEWRRHLSLKSQS